MGSLKARVSTITISQSRLTSAEKLSLAEIADSHWALRALPLEQAVRVNKQKIKRALRPNPVMPTPYGAAGRRRRLDSAIAVRSSTLTIARVRFVIV